MELLPGHTLEEEIARHPDGMPLAAALEVARDVAEALDYAHGKGVVHRDLKPANVMLTPDGTRKVMDFGVARVEGQAGLTTSQVFFGSPVYAAPELAEPKTIGPAADLYSLGVVLFEMLEGRPPFVHESVFRLLELHRGQPLPRREDLPRPLPPEVWQVIARLCAKRPEDRYPGAQPLLVDLNRLLYAMQEEPEPVQGRTA
jgi:serine/threonine-protein kinase